MSKQRHPFIEIKAMERNGSLVQVSVILLGFNIRRLTPSPAKWSTPGEFDDFVHSQVDQIGADIEAKLVALGWTPPSK